MLYESSKGVKRVVATSISVPLAERLEKVGSQRDKSVAGVLREAIDVYLATVDPDPKRRGTRK